MPPRVALVMPHYGDVSLGAARGFHFATSGGVEVVLNVESSGSATPHTFNGLLAVALDARDRGEVTHLAMIHSDVEPSGPWLDALWDAMRSHSADLVSAVVPIKEPGENPRTSTAIGSRDDPWRPLRYVRLGDRHALPTTFGPEHVCGDGEVLLANTGLFLADLRRPWWDDFAFEFRTRIARAPDGRRLAQLAPEDWLLSRRLQQMGGRLLCTWCVPLTHRGLHDWSNR